MKKIILSIFLSSIISIIIFSLIMNIEEKNQSEIIGQLDYPGIHERFLSVDIDRNKENIFIIGSSYTQALDPSIISLEIQQKCTNCAVYNLSIQGDNINKRSSVIDQIIESEPKMIVYGIHENEFVEEINSKYHSSKEFLPSVKEFFESQIIKLELSKITKIPDSPKDKTWNIIRQINKENSDYERIVPYVNTPFLSILKASTIIVSDLELKSLASSDLIYSKINTAEDNKTFKNLKIIIKKFQENKIPIIFFVVPEHKYSLDRVPSEQKEILDKLFEQIKKETNVKIYSREEALSDLPIWHDLFHIAVNENSSIYSENISKIILQELQ